jgi:phosphate starvation-inducible PhoH-like protein
MLASGEIEIAPLAFMRGRTLSDSYVIIDEAQNTTSVQMKMVLTRLGQNSRMVITGDLSQIDLPDNQPSGLADAVERLQGVEGIGIIHLSGKDVVRHAVVARILQAYENT